MPTEIADSDAESDLHSPAKVEGLLPKHLLETQQGAASNDRGVNFSGFPQQEQLLHDEWLGQTTNQLGVKPQESSTGVGNDWARTEHHLAPRALTDAHAAAAQSALAASDSTATTRRKRRHTTRDDWDDTGVSDQVSQKRRRHSKIDPDGKSVGCERSSQMQA